MRQEVTRCVERAKAQVMPMSPDEAANAFLRRYETLVTFGRHGNSFPSAVLAGERRSPETDAER